MSNVSKWYSIPLTFYVKGTVTILAGNKKSAKAKVLKEINAMLGKIQTNGYIDDKEINWEFPVHIQKK